MPVEFNGQLKTNSVIAALYNMIISQQVFADNIKGTFGTLVDEAKVDGSLYGDTKLYVDVDCIGSYAWGADAEATNLLQLHRPPQPKTQELTINKYRQVAVSFDNYLSKNAWGDEGVFNQFKSVVLGLVGTAKRIYESTLYNSFVGTVKGAAAKSDYEIALSDIEETGEAKKRAEAQTIATRLADLFIEMQDVSRDFNDYAFLRSYDMADLKVVWNSKWVNKIRKIDLPTIFKTEGLMGDKFAEYVLPDRYFGEVNATSGTTASSNTTIRSLVERDYGSVHVFPGDLLPESTAYQANETYTVDEDVICKVIHKDAIPFMSSFSVGTSFYNPRALVETNYLTWSHNTLDYLKGKPVITVHSD